MSHNPKKGMYKDDAGVYRFVEVDNPGVPYAKKRWYKGEIVRRAFNSKGEVVRKDKQSTEVFAEEADVPALVCRRCPDPGMGEGNIRVNVYYSPM